MPPTEPSRAADGAPPIERLSELRATGFPEQWYEMADETHFWMRARATVALRLMRSVGLDARVPLVALDVGSGVGLFRSQIEHATVWRVDISDLSLPALERARPGRGRILYYDATDRASSLRAAYDVAFLFDVLEHVERPTQFLAAVLEHLRPGGRLIVNVPALPWLFSAYDAAQGHLRRYTPSALRTELAGLDGTVDAVQYWGLSLVPLLALRKLFLGSRPSSETMREGFRPPGRLANRAASAVVSLELALLPRPFLGTSLMAVVTRAG